ncbi:MAG: hypothetical protein IT168_17650 [Bryobacterales bacterium]|nr:hypothetical protein [Bryobacterales bacterium]
MKPVVFGILLAVVALAADSDAARFQQDLQARHLPFGAVLDPIFALPDSDEIIGYTRCGDSAIWTGHLLAAQSYRWSATRSPEALDGVRNALEAIRKLIDVTGNDTLARCAFPADWQFAAGIVSEEEHHGVHKGVINGESWLWIGNTSRDQYLGVFFGLTAAWNMVDDASVRGGVGWLAKRMLDNLIGHGWTVVMPGGSVSTTFLHRIDQQLALLKLGSRVGSRSLSNAYGSAAFFGSASTALPIGLEVSESLEPYFKFNLDYLSLYCLLSAPDSGWNRDNYRRAFGILRDRTADHDNAFFNMIARVAMGPDPARDTRTAELLDQFLQRPRRDFYVDRTGAYESCSENRACAPMSVIDRVTTDFLWQRSPFQLTGGGSGRIESAGIDYLLPYWMLRALQ